MAEQQQRHAEATNSAAQVDIEVLLLELVPLEM
jgi:hypothetical protein